MKPIALHDEIQERADRVIVRAGWIAGLLFASGVVAAVMLFFQ
jgi:hypothetical protein